MQELYLKKRYLMYQFLLKKYIYCILGRWKHRYGAIDPVGPLGLTNVVYDYFHYVDVGADGGAVRLDETTITESATLIAPNTVRSICCRESMFSSDRIYLPCHLEVLLGQSAFRVGCQR